VALDVLIVVPFWEALELVAILRHL